MLNATQKFTDHLAASHSPRVRAGLYVPDGGSYTFEGYLGVVDGTLTCDYSRNIRRQVSGLRVGSLESTADYAYNDIAARDYLEALTAVSAEVSLEWGLVYPDLTEEWVTLARLRVEEASLTAMGDLQISSAYDAGTRVNDFTLVTPYVPYDIGGVKLTYLAAIRDLVDTSYPSAALPAWSIDPTVDAVSLPPDGTVFTGSRWSAVLALAAAIDVNVGPDHAGVWTVAPTGTDRDPVWTVANGAGGVLIDQVTQFSRRDQYNAVGIRWESPTGGGGLAYIVDADPLSPTYYDGPFGRKPRPEETVDTITTEGQAIAHATAVLAKFKGLTRGISLTSVHNPLLEPNDVVAVFLPDGSAERHVIDTVSLPLRGGSMSLETRILRGGITYEEDGVIYDDSGFTYEGAAV